MTEEVIKFPITLKIRGECNEDQIITSFRDLLEWYLEVIDHVDALWVEEAESIGIFKPWARVFQMSPEEVEDLSANQWNILTQKKFGGPNENDYIEGRIQYARDGKFLGPYPDEDLEIYREELGTWEAEQLICMAK